MFLISLLFIILVVFLFALQPVEIYNMKSPENKAELILLLSINYVFIFSFELLYLNVRKLTDNVKINKIHLVFSGVIVLTTLLFLYWRHPYMTKNHFVEFFFAVTGVVAVFQLLTLFFIKNKFLITPNNVLDKIIVSDNKTTLNIDTGNLILIKAEGNYATVIEKNKKYLIRSSLKKIMKQNPRAGLIRCHKSYIVNTAKIKSISGNSKGYKISLSDYEFEIPVSVEVGKRLKEMFS